MDRGFFINGRWEHPAGLERFDIINPANGEHVGSTLLADAAVVDRCVDAAECACRHAA